MNVKSYSSILIVCFYNENNPVQLNFFLDLLDPSTNLQHLQILAITDSTPAGSLKTNVGTQSKSIAGLMPQCFLSLQTNRSLI